MKQGASKEGTERYAARFASRIPPEHYRRERNWLISSIGLGTYLGDPDDRMDRLYEDAVFRALTLGCNLIDTAINYRFQRSERNIGLAWKKAVAEGSVARDEIVLSTKGGFLSFDGGYPPNPGRYFQDEYFAKGICAKEDVVANCHCMTPAYLENQLERSLQNLQTDCIDIYFIHNPETQLSEITRQEFLRRMLAAFKLLEQKVAEGKIQVYGAATWNGFRENPKSPGYLSLEELIGLARTAAQSDDHHFRAIQLPYNLAMPEALLSKNQMLGSKSTSLIEAAHAQGMIVLSSASIMQAQLASGLPETITDLFPEFATDAQRSIQFVRSTPGVTSALVGMSRVAHVDENLQVASKPPLSWNKLRELFSE